MPCAPENPSIGIDLSTNMLHWKWRHKHLGIGVIDIIDECYFFIVHVDNQHIVHHVECWYAITWQFNHHLFLWLFGYRVELQFAFIAEVKYNITFFIQSDDLGFKLLDWALMK